jgi:hypothetical protein
MMDVKFMEHAFHMVHELHMLHEKDQFDLQSVRSQGWGLTGRFKAPCFLVTNDKC